MGRSTWEKVSWERGGRKRNVRKATHCALCCRKFKRGERKVVVHPGCLGQAMG